MLHREQLIQKESIHPVLHATLQRSDGQTDLLVLVVRNSGKGFFLYFSSLVPDLEMWYTNYENCLNF